MCINRRTRTQRTRINVNRYGNQRGNPDGRIEGENTVESPITIRRCLRNQHCRTVGCEPYPPDKEELGARNTVGSSWKVM
jgi:hypothetical protein